MQQMFIDAMKPRKEWRTEPQFNSFLTRLNVGGRDWNSLRAYLGVPRTAPIPEGIWVKWMGDLIVAYKKSPEWTAFTKAEADAKAKAKADAKAKAVAVAVIPIVKELVDSGVPQDTAIKQVSAEAAKQVVATAPAPAPAPVPPPIPVTPVKIEAVGKFLAPIVTELVNAGVPKEQAISQVAAEATKQVIATAPAPTPPASEQETLKSKWNRASFTLDTNIRQLMTDPTEKSSIQTWIIWNPDKKLFSSVSTMPPDLVVLEKKKEQDNLKLEFDKAMPTLDPNVRAIKSTVVKSLMSKWIVWNPDTKLYSLVFKKPASLFKLEDKKAQDDLKATWELAEIMSVPSVRRTLQNQVYLYLIYDASSQRYAKTTSCPEGVKSIVNVAESVAPIVKELVASGVPEATAVAQVSAEAAKQVIATAPAPTPPASEQETLKSKWNRASFTLDTNIRQLMTDPTEKSSIQTWIIWNPDKKLFSSVSTMPPDLVVLEKKKEQDDLKLEFNKAMPTLDPNVRAIKSTSVRAFRKISDLLPRWIVWNPDTKLYSVVFKKPASLFKLEDKKAQDDLKATWELAEIMSVPSVRRTLQNQVYLYLIYDASSQRYAKTKSCPEGVKPIVNVAESVAPIVKELVASGVPEATAVAQVSAEAAKQVESTAVIIPPVPAMTSAPEVKAEDIDTATAPLVKTMIDAGIPEGKAVDAVASGADKVINALSPSEAASAFAPIIKQLTDSGMPETTARDKVAETTGAVINATQPKKYTAYIIGGAIVVAAIAGVAWVKLKKHRT